MKKRKICRILCGTCSFVLAFVLILSAATASFAWFMQTVFKNLTNEFSASSIVSYFGGGTGTENDPYIINKPEHLYNLAWLQNMGKFDSTTHFKLVADIDMAGGLHGKDETMTSGAIPPIGSSGNPFIGHFNGNGHVISNLWVSTVINDWKEHPEGNTGYSSTHVGMFGYVSEGAIVENFILDRVEVKSHINATIGIICGYADADISNIGVYNGILTVESGVTCQSDYSLLGEVGPNVNWKDKPAIGEGTGGSGGDLVISSEQFVGQITGGSVAAGSSLAVDGALEGTAFYVGALNVSNATGNKNPGIYYKTGNGTYETFTPNSTTTQKNIYAAYEYYKKNGRKFLTANAVPSVTSVTINGTATQMPVNCVWFKPVSAGTAGLAFAKTNNSKDRTMMIYKYRRNQDGTLTELTDERTSFTLPKSLDNGSIIYYEATVEAGYEYAIGVGEGSTDGTAGFIALMLAGTDESFGNNPNGSKTFQNIDYIVRTDVDVSADTYTSHRTLLQIPSGTTTAQGSIYYTAVGNEGNSTVNYYVPSSMGITVSDVSQTKQSTAASFATPPFYKRDDGSTSTASEPSG